MKNPNASLLLYIGMADACAMGTEFVDKMRHPMHFREVLNFGHYVKHPTHQEYAGMYTDDTEMSCANARVLTSHPPPYEPIEFAQAWIDEFNRGGRRKGYARHFQTFLESVRDGEDFLARIRNDSDKNGACMRAVPIGALPEVKDVLEVATLQAKITHDTPPALFSARAVALMAHYALHRDVNNFNGLLGFLRGSLPKDDLGYLARIVQPCEAPVTGKELPLSVETVQAVFHTVVSELSLMEMLEDIILLGGDTDSVAAVTWGIASTLHRTEVLPEFLTRDLERGDQRTGSGYLRDLSFKLMQAYA
ncbi:ADP-ribosylglycohydrolase family protein [Candidatus Uhrbacteria bacterium]|nr:ADP-ribosylglycohydrolase family protein [Candidatus Uhrbacteria bacterium]